MDREFRTLADREHRGCLGKSSGGYAALVHGMKHPDVWGAVASHAGDAGFDLVYGSEWPAALTELSRYRRPALREGRYRRGAAQKAARPGHDDGRVRRFLEHMRGNRRPTSAEITTLMLLAMAASYDPSPSAANGFRLPVDLETGERLPARWKRWLANDPVHLVRRYRDNLKTLRAIFIDCGWRDQYHIHYGARRLNRELERCGIDHRYEEFDGSHSGIDDRLDGSLPFLYRALRS